MQATFAEKEAEWRDQMTILKRELVAKDKKVQVMGLQIKGCGAQVVGHWTTDLEAHGSNLHSELGLLSLFSFFLSSLYFSLSISISHTSLK